ncbi:hypothetical protein DPMN_013322 [Dreissena polymorpha]|uniref:Uncharacterized protein n=1 Tax=Dreissena polymorpha TaxID=45954 RepID=A0A9D4N8R3_DREPO|nr:hypothetical protein DPMN_013322 [Dreissena polymorpha]
MVVLKEARVAILYLMVDGCVDRGLGDPYILVEAITDWVTEIYFLVPFNNPKMLSENAVAMVT